MIYRRKIKDKNIRKVYQLRLLCSIIKEVFRDVMYMKNLSYLLYGGERMFVGKESNNQQKGMVKTCENKREYGRTC